MLSWLYRNGGKRAWDIAGAALSLALAAVPLAICMVLIRWETPGPALLGQVRIGRGGKPFRMWKLRSMVRNAEPGGQPRFAQPEDARATRVGAWLRAWHGDELPQLWNVLTGQMSLVGPRPERPCFATRFAREIPRYAERHEVRPGITGWAQIHSGYASDTASTRVKTRYDLAYLATAGWRRDWCIWCRTWRVAAAALQHRQPQRQARTAAVAWRATPARRWRGNPRLGN